MNLSFSVQTHKTALLCEYKYTRGGCGACVLASHYSQWFCMFRMVVLSIHTYRQWIRPFIRLSSPVSPYIRACIDARCMRRVKLHGQTGRSGKKHR